MSTAENMPLSGHNNNNNRIIYNCVIKRSSITSVSSASSCHSDSSEDIDANIGKKIDELSQNTIDNEKSDIRRYRSMSDGAAQITINNNNNNNRELVEVFPSLPDAVLEKMGLLGNGPRERLNEEELEQKFVSLSLAFTIDAATVKDRCQRQRRYRDQTETNLNNEFEKLIQKANRIQRLCIDAETTELLTALLTQIDVVMRASQHATTASERYGAVQHEERISESVTVMINHVNLLKQQRDSTRRQLQYTKRVLQNSNTESPSPPPSATKQQTPVTNGRIISRRRASIATFTQPNETLKSLETRKITRRTSDLSLRASSVTRNSRPSRLELGVDLGKIKEGMVTHTAVIREDEPLVKDTNELLNHEVEAQAVDKGAIDENDGDDDDGDDGEVYSSLDEIPCVQQDNIDMLPLKERLSRKLRKLQLNIEDKYSKWSDDGTIHEICSFCALICFSISLITMANILIEFEFSKRGLNPSKFFWYSTNYYLNGDLSKNIHPDNR